MTHIQGIQLHKCFWVFQIDPILYSPQVSLWINKGLFGPNKAIGLILISLAKLSFSQRGNNEVFTSYKLLAERR